MCQHSTYFVLSAGSFMMENTSRKKKNSLQEINVHNLHKALTNYFNKSGERFHYEVTTFAEIMSVIKRKSMYADVKWTDDQNKEFEQYWQFHYGRKIYSGWHKIYESINNQFCVQYIPEMLFTTKIERLLNDYQYADVLADKSLVDTFAQAVGCHVPGTILVKSKGIFYDHNRNLISHDKACRILKEYKDDIIIKPTIDSGSGRAVHFMNEEERTHIENSLTGMGSDFIAQEAIKQHPVFSSINPSSVNTLRVMTYILNDNFYHIPIALRMGNGNIRVDNIHAGGLVVGVLDDGKVLPNAYQLGYGDNKKCFNRHPATGVEFRNIVLPAIGKVLETAYNVHSRFPRLGIASWDFTVDEENNPILIEANLINQSIWFPQIVHGKGGFGKNTSELLYLLKNKRRS